MTAPKILIYGATGYTGRLVVEELLRQTAAGHRPTLVLGGRNAAALDDLAGHHRLESRAFPIDAPATPGVAGFAIDAALADVAVVINAAGPYGATARPLAQACVRERVHYLDMSGEQRTFHDLADVHDQARQSGVALVTGAAFSTFAAEELVRFAHKRLEALAWGATRPVPLAHTVRVALSRVDALSRGSLQTMLESIREGVVVRRNGRLAVVPAGELDRVFDFGPSAANPDRRPCMAMNLAEVEAIWRSTGAPNVEAYVQATAIERGLCELGSQFATVLRMRPWKALSSRFLGMWPAGPTADERSAETHVLVAEIEDRYQRVVRARLETDNPYDFSVRVAAELARELVSRRDAPGGLRTPRQVCADLGLDAAARILGQRQPVTAMVAA